MHENTWGRLTNLMDLNSGGGVYSGGGLICGGVLPGFYGIICY